jgi:hypothetical protein
MGPPELTKNGPKIDFQLKIGPYKYGDLELVILFANPAKKVFRQVIGTVHQHQMQLPIPPVPDAAPYPTSTHGLLEEPLKIEELILEERLVRVT